MISDLISEAKENMITKIQDILIVLILSQL